MEARDVMSAPVHTVGPDCPVETIAGILLDRHISAVPVVAPDDRLIGIVSEGDLFRRAELGTERRRSWWLRLLTDPDRLAEEFTRSHGRRAADVMTRDVVTVSKETPVTVIAELLETHGIKRVPVVRDGRCVGIVSRSSLLRALAGRRADALPVPADDRALRDALLATLRAEPWFAPGRVELLVHDGTVELWGVAISDAERAALRAAVAAQPGVGKLVDRIARPPRLAWTRP